MAQRSGNKQVLTDEVIATEMLVTAKAAVRSYGVAITETASSDVHAALKEQLNQAIDLHHKIAQLMDKKGFYYAYDLDKQFANDEKKADMVLKKVTEE